MDWITPQWPAPDKIKACITTRTGGISQLPYQSFNLGLHVGDSPDAVTHNRKLLSEQLGLEIAPQWLEQVHGTKVIDARPDGLVRTADASYTTQTGQACLVMTADCLPILLCNKAGTEVAALHCGWRSLAKGLVAEALAKFSSTPNELMAYLGPAIAQPHFEVGVDVLEAFFESSRSPEHTDQIAHAFIAGTRPLHFYADIYALARAELSSLGVTDIYGGDFCTFEDSARFYSYRRDKVTGRMASLIWIEA